MINYCLLHIEQKTGRRTIVPLPAPRKNLNT